MTAASSSKSIAAWRREFLETGADCWIVPKGGIGSGSFQMEIAARITGTRLFTIEHSTPPEICRPRRLLGRIPVYGFWRLKKLFQYDLRGAGPTQIVAVSGASAERFRDCYGYSASKLQVVRNGVDCTKFQFDEQHRLETRRRFGIPAEATVVGSVGRLVGQKAFDVAIAALQKVRSRCVSADPWLVIFGEGPLREQLLHAVGQAGLSNHVLLPGATREPWRVYPAFDIFLMTSEIEGLPLTLIEAMASCCVPIAYSVGGIPEVVRHGTDGFLVEPGDFDSLVRTLQSIIALPANQRQELGRTSRRRVADSFEENTQMELLCDLIETGGDIGIPESDITGN